MYVMHGAPALALAVVVRGDEGLQDVEDVVHEDKAPDLR